MKQSHTLRQIFIISGLTLCSVTDGLIFGQMSGMINALRSDGEIKLDEDDISWIASVINFTCFGGTAVSTLLNHYYGRRKSITIICLLLMICWTMVYFAPNKMILLLSRFIVGITYGGILISILMCVGEYVSPKHRSLCVNIICAVGLSLGTTVGHVLSIFMHWRNVALVCMIPTVLSAVIPLFWYESPSWLATKNRFEECEISFKALHCASETSDKELTMLIESQKLQRFNKNRINDSFIFQIKQVIEALKRRYYWRVTMILFIICLYKVAAGKVFLNTFALTMLQEVTGSSDILFYTLIVDGFVLLGSTLACLVVNRFKMRKLLFLSGGFANVVQVVLAFCLYLWSNNDDRAKAWVKVSLVAIYFIFTAGPYAVLETLLSEVHPLHIKASSLVLSSVVAGIMQTMNIQISIKLSTIGYHLIFFSNSVIIFVCLIYLYFYLPETSGRTLQEIELYFQNGSYPNTSVLPENTKMLKLNESSK